MTATIPSNGVPCLSHGRCGFDTGWHYADSDAAVRCARLAREWTKASSALGDGVHAITVGRDGDSKRSSERLDTLTLGEQEMYDGLRRAALASMPFLSHILFTLKPMAIREEATVIPSGEHAGELFWQDRAAVDKHWRLMINFDWIAYEYEKSFERFGGEIRKSIDKDNAAQEKAAAAAAAAGNSVTAQAARAAIVKYSDEDIAEGAQMLTTFMLSKVLLHEAGHAMYDNFDSDLDPSLLNMAEDAVINNSLRRIGLTSAEQKNLPNSNIHGAFIEDAVFGGSIKCSDPSHSWVHTTASGVKESRCDFDQSIAHYYACLQAQRQDNPNQGSEESSSGVSARSGQSAQKGGQGQSGESSHAGDQGTPGCGRATAEKFKDDPLGQGGVSDETKEVSKSVTAAAIEAWANENPTKAAGIGLGSNSMARRWARHRRAPDGVRWEAELNSCLYRTVKSVTTTKRTYQKPDRRTLGMSGGTIRRGSTRGDAPAMVSVIDTSASMSDHDLFAAVNSTGNVMRRLGVTEMKALAVDAACQQLPTRITKLEDLRGIIKGGGGTDMAPGIRAASASGADVAVVFTDAEVPWGALQTRPRDISPSMKVVVAVISKDADTAKPLRERIPSWMSSVTISTDLIGQADGKSSGPYLG